LPTRPSAVHLRLTACGDRSRRVASGGAHEPHRQPVMCVSLSPAAASRQVGEVIASRAGSTAATGTSGCLYRAATVDQWLAHTSRCIDYTPAGVHGGMAPMMCALKRESCRPERGCPGRSRCSAGTDGSVHEPQRPSCVDARVLVFVGRTYPRGRVNSPRQGALACVTDRCHTVQSRSRVGFASVSVRCPVM